jgi:hypothetical protein
LAVVILQVKHFRIPDLGDWPEISSQGPDFFAQLLPSLPVPCPTDRLCHGISSPFPLLTAVPPPVAFYVSVSPVPKFIT